MAASTWRGEWSAFRVALVDETARCVAEQRSFLSRGRERSWKALAADEQVNLTEFVASVFAAQDQAMANLDKRGETI
jgi:hypothetical protein